jgi:hypothetical protein
LRERTRSNIDSKEL